MHDIRKKEKALYMRLKGLSITDIADSLGLNKTTISYWCRDIKLSSQQLSKLETQRKDKAQVALLKYAERNRIERIKKTLEEKMMGEKLFDLSSENSVLAIGLGLYWGEGYKESNGEMGFTNSNPKVIKFYLKWLQMLGVEKGNLIFRLTINEQFTNLEGAIKKFWIRFLSVNYNQFSKTSIIKSYLKKANINKTDHYKGVLRVKVRKGLSLKNKILGAIEYVANGR